MSTNKSDGWDDRDNDRNGDRDHQWPGHHDDHGHHDDDCGPAVQVTAITALSADTGASRSDFITSVAAQTVTGTFSGHLREDEHIQVSADSGTTWINATASGQTWSATGVTLASGSGSLITRTVDDDGHTLAGASHAYVLDAAALAPTLIATFVDSGASGTDHITNATAATLSGAVEAGATVKIYDGAKLIATVGANATTGAWSYDTIHLANGMHNFSATQTDIAGNLSVRSAQSTMTVDTIAPVAPAVALANDTGTSHTDKLTYDGTLALNRVETGATVQYSTDGGTTWSSSFSAHEGANSVLARQTDIAGNISAAAKPLSFTLDTFAAAPVVALAHDTGISGTDHITKDGTLTVTGLESGATVQYSTNGGTTWASSFSAQAGLVSVQVHQLDVAGNVSAATALAFTLDTSTPPPTINGVSQTAAGTYLGFGTAEAGSTVTVHNGSAIPPTTTADSNGAWTVALGTGAPPSFTVTAVDMAGNLSSASAPYVPAPVHVVQPLTLNALTGASYTDTQIADVFPAATGQLALTVPDPNTGATHSFGISGGVASTALAGYNLADTGTYGTVYLNSGTGGYTYVPNNAAINALPAGVTGHDNFSLTVSDSVGATASTPLAFTLNGAEDASAISGVLPFNYTVGGPATLVAPNLTLGNVDSGGANATSATVAISAGYSPGNDLLSYNSSLLQSGMAAAYVNGVLTISGSGTLAAYQAVLDSVTFQTTTAGARTIGFTVSDGSVHSITVDTSNLSLDNLSTTGFRLPGAAAYNASGFSVSSAGDINGDGYADVIVGAPFATPHGLNSGASYVVFGHAGQYPAEVPLSSLNGSNGFSISGAAAGYDTGISVSAAGDVNGDGIADLIVGAPYANPHGQWSGASYVVFGHTGGFGQNLDLSTLTGTQGFRISGEAGGDYAGRAVHAAGDVNGDGFGDLIIGAPRASASAAYSGAAYVVFGHAGGFGVNGNVDLSSLNGSNGFKLSGTPAGDWAGASVSAAGDVNGDGFGDLIIGAPHAGPNVVTGTTTAFSGATYVVFGHAGGFGVSGNVDLSTLDATNGGFSIVGTGTGVPTPISAGGNLGYSVTTAGDVNGDGFADVIVGAPYATTANSAGAGAAYVVFGHAGGFGTVDPVTHISDGNVNLAHLTQAQGFEIIGAAAGDRAGYSVHAAGDVNGDGYGDLIIGAPSAKDNGGNPAGTSYVIFGTSSGIGTVDAAGNAIVDLAHLLPNEGFKISAVGPGNDSGYAVSAAGDVNGDGFADLIVGSSNASPHTGTSAGESYVIFGSKFIVTSDTYEGIGGPGTSYTLHGTTANDSFIAGQGNATMYGDGGVDSFSGGAGNDTIHLGLTGNSSSAFLKIDGGGGFNTLALDGSGMRLDLTAAGVDGRVHNIEHIDLGSGNNTLALDIRDLLNTSGGSHTLQVGGVAGDVVEIHLDPGTSAPTAWPQGADQTIGGAIYHSYADGLANLLVDTHVAVSFV